MVIPNLVLNLIEAPCSKLQGLRWLCIFNIITGSYLSYLYILFWHLRNAKPLIKLIHKIYQDPVIYQESSIQLCLCKGIKVKLIRKLNLSCNTRFIQINIIAAFREHEVFPDLIIKKLLLLLFHLFRSEEHT